MKKFLVGRIQFILKNKTTFFFFFALPFFALLFPLKGSFIFSCGLLGLYDLFSLRKEVFKNKIIYIFILAFLYLVVLFLVFKKGEALVFFEYFWGLVIIVSLLMHDFKTPKEYLEFVIALLVYTFILYIIVSYFELFFGIRQPRSHYFGLENVEVKYIPTGTFTNENDYASYLVMCLSFFSLYYKKSAYIFFILIAAMLIFLTQSRLNILCLFILLFIRIFLSIKKTDKRIVFMVMYVLCMYLIIRYIVIPLSPLVGDIVSLIIRKNLIFIALQNVFLKRNLWGYGVGGFEIMMQSQDYNALTYGHIDPHCWYIELLVEGGIVVFLLLLFFIVRFSITLCNKFRESDGSLHKYVLSVFCIFLLTVFSSSSFSPNIWNWFFFGVFVKYYQIVKSDIKNRELQSV